MANNSKPLTNRPRENRYQWSDAQVRKHLELGEEVSTLEQVDGRGGWRLGAVIHRLKKQGMKILSYTKPGFGRCAFYRLVLDSFKQQDMFGATEVAPCNQEG